MSGRLEDNKPKLPNIQLPCSSFPTLRPHVMLNICSREEGGLVDWDVTHCHVDEKINPEGGEREREEEPGSYTHSFISLVIVSLSSRK